MAPIDGDAVIDYIEKRCAPTDLIEVWRVIEIIEHTPVLTYLSKEKKNV